MGAIGVGVAVGVGVVGTTTVGVAVGFGGVGVAVGLLTMSDVGVGVTRGRVICVAVALGSGVAVPRGEIGVSRGSTVGNRTIGVEVGRLRSGVGVARPIVGTVNVGRPMIGVNRRLGMTRVGTTLGVAISRRASCVGVGLILTGVGIARGGTTGATWMRTGARVGTALIDRACSASRVLATRVPANAVAV